MASSDRPPVRRTLLVLGGMTVAAIGVYILVARFSYPFPRELTDPELDEDVRREKVRELVRATPTDKRPALLRAAARQEDGETLALIVLRAAMEIDPENAGPVLEAYRRKFPDAYMGYVLLVEFRTRQARFDEAIRLYQDQAAQAGESEDGRRTPLWPFLQAMTAVGHAADAYAAADPRDAAYAFRVLASFLEHPTDRHGPGPPHEQLRQVIAAHQARAGVTPWTVYFNGVVLQEDGNLEDAQRAYADATRGLNDAGFGPTKLQAAGLVANWEDRTWDRARARRVECLYRLGRWAEAYDECEPADSTFQQLAQRMEGQQQWDELMKLALKHWQRFPNEPAADLWQAVAHFGRGEYGAAIPLVDRYLAAEPQRLRQDHRAFQVKFRSQVRLGRLDDARKTHEAEARFFPRLTAMMILALKTGDDRTVETLLAEDAKHRSDAGQSFYSDEDAGPLLRSERWAAIRARYPPPEGR